VESLWPVLASAMNGKPELAPWLADLLASSKNEVPLPSWCATR